MVEARSSWHMLQVRPDADFATVSVLASHGIPAISVRMTKTTINRKTRKKVTSIVPAFSPYVFVCLAPQDWATLRRVHEVLGVVRSVFTREPLVVPPGVVEALGDLSETYAVVADNVAAALNPGDVVSLEFFGRRVNARIDRVSERTVHLVAEFGVNRVTIARSVDQIVSDNAGTACLLGA